MIYEYYAGQVPFGFAGFAIQEPFVGDNRALFHFGRDTFHVGQAKPQTALIFPPAPILRRICLSDICRR